MFHLDRFGIGMNTEGLSTWTLHRLYPFAFVTLAAFDALTALAAFSALAAFALDILCAWLVWLPLLRLCTAEPFLST